MRMENQALIRPLAREEQFRIAQLQASLGRFVGTHYGNGMRYERTSSLRTELLSGYGIRQVRRKSTSLSGIESGHLTTLLKDTLPSSSEMRIVANVTGLALLPTPDRLQKLVLELDSQELRNENLSLAEAFSEIANVDVYPKSIPNIVIAYIGNAASAKTLENAPFAVPEQVTLEPMVSHTVRPVLK